MRNVGLMLKHKMENNQSEDDYDERKKRNDITKQLTDVLVDDPNQYILLTDFEYDYKCKNNLFEYIHDLEIKELSITSSQAIKRIDEIIEALHYNPSIEQVYISFSDFNDGKHPITLLYEITQKRCCAEFKISSLSMPQIVTVGCFMFRNLRIIVELGLITCNSETMWAKFLLTGVYDPRVLLTIASMIRVIFIPTKLY